MSFYVLYPCLLDLKVSLCELSVDESENKFFNFPQNYDFEKAKLQKHIDLTVKNGKGGMMAH